MTDERLRLQNTLAVCANTLEYVVGKVIGVESAELRIHPTAPGEVGIRVTYHDGTVVWLVAEAA